MPESASITATDVTPAAMTSPPATESLPTEIITSSPMADSQLASGNLPVGDLNGGFGGDLANGSASGFDFHALIGQIQSIIDMGGPVVMLLLVLSVLSLAVILYKLWQFSLIGIGRHSRARKALALWRTGKRADALSLLDKGKSPVSIVVAHAMRGQVNHPDKQALIREDIERVAVQSLSQTRVMLRFLETVGQISPLLGLFGTVIGMIEAFQRLQEAGATVDPSVLAGGIWVALLTTAVGLAVAIPASLFADWFTSRVEREQSVMEELVTAVLTGQITDKPHPETTEMMHSQAELLHAS
ncbi:MotA/TolQ/ExbB proton channel family protein [uncultured Cohaesibacter sp.]|uniref:MotA/TolQ/ExbB proton channel family protein n=1 Tax=uncultured Cohaesibacter sp. TaxID=1002546 RepID=UPI0029C9AF73|nr:MotA/TolQ/ExbB proton channel family protein [uncultured Cohaesibacter sp.]